MDRDDIVPLILLLIGSKYQFQFSQRYDIEVPLITQDMLEGKYKLLLGIDQVWCQQNIYFVFLIM